MRSPWLDLMMLDGPSFPIHRSRSLLSRRAPWASDPPNCCGKIQKEKGTATEVFPPELVVRGSTAPPRYAVPGFGFQVSGSA